VRVWVLQRYDPICRATFLITGCRTQSKIGLRCVRFYADNSSSLLVQTDRLTGVQTAFVIAPTPALASTQSALTGIPGLVTPMVKRPQHSTDDSSPSSVNAQNVWRYTSFPHTPSWCVGSLITGTTLPLPLYSHSNQWITSRYDLLFLNTLLFIHYHSLSYPPQSLILSKVHAQRQI
jgi:hypothetical protein